MGCSLWAISQPRIWGYIKRGFQKSESAFLSNFVRIWDIYPPFLKTVFLHSLKLSSNWTEYEMQFVMDVSQESKKWYVGIVSWKDRLVQSNAMQGLGHLTWLKSPVKRSLFFSSTLLVIYIGIVSYSMVAVSWKGRWERRREKPLEVFPFSELPRM